MSQVVPTSIELSDYRQVTSLDGRDYVLRFIHNAREDRWYVQISDQDGDPIVSTKVVAEIDLLQRVTDPRRPPGKLVARDLSATDPSDTQPKILSEDPGLRDLGGRVTLLYFTAAEVETDGL